MSEHIVREALAEKERQRDRVADADRFGRLESTLAVLRTQFDAVAGASLSKEDIDAAKKEMEEHVASTIEHVCDHFDKQLAQHSKDQLEAHKKMTRIAIKRAAADQVKTRKRMAYYGLVMLAVVLSIAGKDGAVSIIKWAAHFVGV